MNSIQIIYENDDILIVNKNAGTAVQGGKGISHPLDSELSSLLGYKIHLVHRLDRETAGLLIVAKNAAAAAKWTSLISGKTVQKEYKAVCFGKPYVNGKFLKEGIFDETIEKNGRILSAKTFFNVEKNGFIEIQKSPQTEEPSSPEKTQSEKIEFSVLNLRLGTGRMHQIRIHLSKAGCPILCDDRHGNFKLNKKIRRLGAKKLMLCAYKISFPEKRGNKTVQRTIEIPLPDYMTDFINKIQ